MRRRALTSLALSIGLWRRAAWAGTDSYPSRPIRLVVGSAAGSSPDAIARLVVAGMSVQLGEPVIVENRPGASSALGTDVVAKAAPDGYVAGYVTPSLVLNPALNVVLPFNGERDLQPVVHFGSQPLVLVVPASSRFATLEQLIDEARRRPVQVSFASTGAGSIFHLTAERLAFASGTRFLHVPYVAGPHALTDLMSGEVDCMFNAVNAVLPHLRSGRLRGLAVTSRDRCALLPDLPAVAQRVAPGFEVQSWGGLVVPARTPREIVTTLNASANTALKETHVASALRDNGYEVVGGTPERFREFLRQELVDWSDIVARMHVKVR